MITGHACTRAHCDRPVDTDTDGRPALVCARDVTDLIAGLHAVDDLTAALEAKAARLRGVDYRALQTRGRPGSSEPLDLGALELAGHLRAAVHAWGGLDTAQADGFPWWDQAPEMTDRLLEAIGRAKAAVHGRPERWWAGPCPACDADRWGITGRERVRCACGRTDPAGDVRAQLVEAARDQIAGPTVIANALQRLGIACAPSRLWQWHRRGKITPAGGTTERPTFRVGDVVDLLDAAQARRAAAAARRAG